VAGSVFDFGKTMTIGHSDRSFDPPDVCKSCGKYHVFKQGRCFECYHAEWQEHADQQRKERQIEKHFGREKE
jgi:hypothetical protein